MKPMRSTLVKPAPRGAPERGSAAYARHQRRDPLAGRFRDVACAVLGLLLVSSPIHGQARGTTEPEAVTPPAPRSSPAPPPEQSRSWLTEGSRAGEGHSFLDRLGLELFSGATVEPARQILGGAGLWFSVGTHLALRGRGRFGMGEDFKSVTYSAEAVLRLPLLCGLEMYGTGGAVRHREYSDAGGRYLDRRVWAPRVGGGIRILEGPLRLFAEGAYSFGEFPGDALESAFDYDVPSVVAGIRYGGY